MKLIILIIALLLAMSTNAFSQERVELLFSNRSFQIYYIVEDHFSLVHFEGDMDVMSSFYIFTALEFTQSDYLSMNSTGGYMDESYVLGKFLASKQDITFVVRNDNVCMSACAFAALSSKKIMIGKNGLDFHTPYIPYVDSFATLSEFSLESQRSVLGLMHYLDNAGYGYDFLQLMLDYTSQKDFVTFYSQNDLEFFKVENFFDKIDRNDVESKYKLNTR